MMYATGVVTMMMATAAVAPTRTAAVAVPQKNGRDLLFSDDSSFKFTADDQETVGKDHEHGYVGSVFNHFSKFGGYQSDDSYDKTEDPYTKNTYSTVSKAVCSSYASASAFQHGIDAHLGFTKHAILEFCEPTWDGKIKHMYGAAEKYAAAVAKAVTATQADCVSEGNAFGCASATATAEAWAEAYAEAHVTAVAKAFDDCEARHGCPIEVASLSVAHAETFIHMSVDVFSRSEVYACSKHDSSAWAGAYSKCAAVAYAKIWTEAYAKAYLKTGCASGEAATVVSAETGSDYYTIEGCERDGGDGTTGHGTAGYTTHGSDAEAIAYEYFPVKH